jgi:hypothetical protein
MNLFYIVAVVLYTRYMTKIWAKVVVNHRVKKGIIHDCEERVDIVNFFSHVHAICEKLKIPTPVVLNCYAENFIEFNILKFKPRDFIEEVSFDWLVLENGE